MRICVIPASIAHTRFSLYLVGGDHESLQGRLAESQVARQFQVNFLCAHMQDRVIPTANKQEIWRRWGISPASRPRPQDGWQLAGVHRNPAGGISFKLGGIAHSEPADIPGGSSTSRGRNFVQTNISPEGPLLAMGRRLAACICNRGLASAQVGLCAQQRRGARPS